MSDLPRFDFNIWGIKISAQGAVGIAAAVVVVMSVLAFSRHRLRSSLTATPVASVNWRCVWSNEWIGE